MKSKSKKQPAKPVENKLTPLPKPKAAVSRTDGEHGHEYEIKKTLSLSTGHMTEHDNKLLTELVEKNDEPDADIDFRLDVEADLCGFDIKLGAEILSEDATAVGAAVEMATELGLSAAFCDVLKLADGLGCDEIKFDADAPVYEHLPLFDW